MGYKEEHKKWINAHLAKRKGERRDRLRRGHKHGEQLFLKKVWWPLFGNFQGLHPEYEVIDWRGMRFFVDFLWQSGDVHIAFEIKGYGPHVEQSDRTRYKRELNRELFLHGIGYKVVSIAYDELEGNPKLIKSFMRSIITPYLGENQKQDSKYNRLERDVLRLTLRQGRKIRPAEVVREFGVSQKTAIKYLQQLTAKGSLIPIKVGRSQRVMRYEFIGSFFDISMD